jgi:hypothetical protein
MTVSNGSIPSGRDHWRWYSPHRAIVLLGVVLILVALAGGVLGVVNASRAEQLSSRLANQYLVLLGPVRQIRASESAFQVLAEEAFSKTVPATDVITGAVTNSNDLNKAYLTLQHLLALPGNEGLAPQLASRMSAFTASQSGLSAFLAGAPQTSETTHAAAV